jgi:hypothetical protein
MGGMRGKGWGMRECGGDERVIRKCVLKRFRESFEGSDSS